MFQCVSDLIRFPRLCRPFMWYVPDAQLREELDTKRGTESQKKGKALGRNASKKDARQSIVIRLVVESTLLKKYRSNLKSSPTRGENQKIFETPTRFRHGWSSTETKKKECRIPEKRIRNGIWMDMLWVMPWNGHLFFPGGYLCFKGVVSLILQTPIFSKRCSGSRGPRLTHSGKWGYWGFQDKICMSSSNKYSV